jgi:two-component system cell cycle sensor histidine kinase/response regulator CckA
MADKKADDKKAADQGGGDLRSRAEQLAGNAGHTTQKYFQTQTLEQSWNLLHELRVHQIELEIQNEELRQAQLEIDAAKARYFDLYDLAPVGYVVVSEAGITLEANLTTATMLGVGRGTLIGQSLARHVWQADQDAYYLFRKRLFESAEPLAIELRMTGSGSEPLWVLMETALADDGKGTCTGRVVLIDITARRTAEQEREDLREQLIQSQKLESIGRLAGGIAHDFNNMLAVILGNVDAADQQAVEDPLVRDSLLEIRGAAERAAALTRQLLAFARKQTVEPRVLDLNDAVTGSLKMLRRLLSEGILLDWRPGTSLWPVHMDPMQVDQILTNLCVNARSAISGAGHISIVTRNLTLDEAGCGRVPGLSRGDYVLLSVCDSGSGMDAATASRVFEPFFTTREFGQGTGLGLATVYGAVKQNGGHIVLDSHPGLGTTLTIYLPRYLGAEPIRGAVAATREPERGHETVLVVEDEPAVLDMITAMLEFQGYTVVATSSPNEAIRLVREKAVRIDVLLTDVVMPEMNGRTLVSQLEALHPHLKHVFMSGYPADLITDQGILEQGALFIQKPFSRTDLADGIQRALKRPA